MAKRLALLATVAALAAAGWAPFRVARVFASNGHALDANAFWMAIPIVAGLLAIGAVRTPWTGLTWLLSGCVCGFVILGAWSVGTFFAIEGLLLIIAATVHLFAAKPGWRGLLAPVWFVAGAAAPAVLFLLRDAIDNARCGNGFVATSASRFVFGSGHGGGCFVTSATAVVYGVWIFIGAIALAAIGTLIVPARPRTTPAGGRA